MCSRKVIKIFSGDFSKANLLVKVPLTKWGKMQFYFRSNSSVVKYPHYSPEDRKNSLGPFLIFIISPVLHSHYPLSYIPTNNHPHIHPEGSTEEKSSGQKCLCWGQILLHFYLLPYELAATTLPLSLAIHFTLDIPQSSHEYSQRQRNMLGNNRKFIIYRFGKW